MKVVMWPITCRCEHKLVAHATRYKSHLRNDGVLELTIESMPCVLCPCGEFMQKMKVVL